MPFTVKEFPGQRFKSMEEYEEAKRARKSIEKSLAERAEPEEITRVTATLIPAPKGLVEGKVVELEGQIAELTETVRKLAAGPDLPSKNKEELDLGLVLQGESQGQKYTLEVIEDGYMCSDGVIYESLSGAALGVSGNRRSGWKFWKNVEGRSIGEIEGRFGRDAELRSVGA